MEKAYAKADFSSGLRIRSFLRAASKRLGGAFRGERERERGGERLRAIRPRVSWQTLWLTDVPLRGRIPRSHACATRHIPLSFTFFPAVSLLLGILSTLTRQQPPLAHRASRALSRHFPLPSPLLLHSFSIHQLLAAAAAATAATAAVAPLPRPPPAGFSAPFLLFAFHASSLLLFVFFRRVYTRLRSLRSLGLSVQWSSSRTGLRLDRTQLGNRLSLATLLSNLSLSLFLNGIVNIYTRVSRGSKWTKEKFRGKLERSLRSISLSISIYSDEGV